MWRCVHCESLVEDDEWNSCWKCSKDRDVTPAGYEEAQRGLKELEVEIAACRLAASECASCSGEMVFEGVLELRHGETWLFSGRKPDDGGLKLSLYHCSRCGKVAWFKPDIGLEFRSEQERAWLP